MSQNKPKILPDGMLAISGTLPDIMRQLCQIMLGATEEERRRCRVKLRSGWREQQKMPEPEPWWRN